MQHYLKLATLTIFTLTTINKINKLFEIALHNNIELYV